MVRGGRGEWEGEEGKGEEWEGESGKGRVGRGEWEGESGKGRVGRGEWEGESGKGRYYICSIHHHHQHLHSVGTGHRRPPVRLPTQHRHSTLRPCETLK